MSRISRIEYMLKMSQVNNFAMGRHHDDMSLDKINFGVKNLGMKPVNLFGRYEISHGAQLLEVLMNGGATKPAAYGPLDSVDRIFKINNIMEYCERVGLSFKIFTRANSDTILFAVGLKKNVDSIENQNNRGIMDSEHHREVGLALGYPKHNVEKFVEHMNDKA